MDYKQLGTLLVSQGAVNFQYAEDQLFPWAVSFRGNGHYFSDVKFLVGYVCGRNWIRPNQCDSLAEALQILSAGILVVEQKRR